MRTPYRLVRTTALAVPFVLALAPRPGTAAPVVYYHAGAWHAFTDKDANGKDVCGIATTNPSDGRELAMTYTIGGSDLSFRATKPTWNIPDGTQLNVAMQIDSNEAWPAEADGSGTSVAWSVGAASINTWDGLFRAGTTLTLTYPSGNEAPWTMSLAGSTAASETLWRCVQDISDRDHVTSPASNAPQASQPYGQSGNAPTQPFAPPAAGAAQPAPANSGQPANTQPTNAQPANSQPSATQPSGSDSSDIPPLPPGVKP